MISQLMNISPHKYRSTRSHGDTHTHTQHKLSSACESLVWESLQEHVLSSVCLDCVSTTAVMDLFLARYVTRRSLCPESKLKPQGTWNTSTDECCSLHVRAHAHMCVCVCVTGAGVPQYVQLPLHRDLRGWNDDEGNHNKTHIVSEHFAAKLIFSSCF